MNQTKTIGMVDAVKLFIANYFNFSGRASRSEFWWCYLALIIASIVCSIIDGVFWTIVLSISLGIDNIDDPTEPLVITSYIITLTNLLSLVTFIGWLSLTVRRFHDRGFSGWWVAAAYIISIPWTVVFIWSVVEFMDILMYGGELSPALITAGIITTLPMIAYSIFSLYVTVTPPVDDVNKWGRNPLLD